MPMPYLERMGMQACGNCGTENPEGARFCMSCGNALARNCPNCGNPAPRRGPLLHVCGFSLAADGDACRAAAAHARAHVRHARSPRSAAR